MYTLEKPLKEVKALNHIPGWMDGHIMKRLQELGKDKQVIVNVGAWKGRSCAALAQECKGVVWAIDHWRGSPDELEINHQQAAEDPLSVYWEFCQYMAHFSLLGTKVIPITGDSPDVARRLFKAYSIDLAFLDGAHDFKSVWLDLVAWTGRVKQGGVLCGDDYSWPGVRRAVDEFYWQYRYVHNLGDLETELDGKLWLVRREL